MGSWHTLKASNVIATGDYDYADSDDLPAGCEDMDWQHTGTIGTNNAALSAQPPFAARVSGLLSASAPPLGSAVPADAAPVQSTASETYMDKSMHNSDTASNIAPASGPKASPRNATPGIAMQVASESGGSIGRQGQIKLRCKPIAARGDPPHHMSGVNLFLVVLGCIVAIFNIAIWVALAYRGATTLPKQAVLVVNQAVAS